MTGSLLDTDHLLSDGQLRYTYVDKEGNRGDWEFNSTDRTPDMIFKAVFAFA
jgi:hypothetical protein